MTVIAWDGETLAADREMGAYSTRSSTTKIIRRGDVMIGGAGASAHVRAFMAWYFNDGPNNPEKFPLKKDDDYTIFVIHRSGRIEVYDQSGVPHPAIVEARYHAIGNGAPHAMTAMYLGCDAKRAVEVANELCIYCGGGVDTLTFEDAPPEA